MYIQTYVRTYMCTYVCTCCTVGSRGYYCPMCNVYCRVISHESKNKMGLNNIVRIFGPTLMTVDGDTVRHPFYVKVIPRMDTLPSI